MRVVIQENYEKMCKWAADYIASKIKDSGIFDFSYFVYRRMGDSNYIAFYFRYLCI